MRKDSEKITKVFIKIYMYHATTLLFFISTTTSYLNCMLLSLYVYVLYFQKVIFILNQHYNPCFMSNSCHIQFVTFIMLYSNELSVSLIKCFIVILLGCYKFSMVLVANGSMTNVTITLSSPTEQTCAHKRDWEYHNTLLPLCQVS